MLSDAQYAAACAPAHMWRVCGVRLRPFSLGHLLALNGVGSPFVERHFTEATPLDLVSAIRICSQRAVGAPTFLSALGFRPSQADKNVGAPWSLRWRWLIWRVQLCQRRDRMRYISRLAIFQEYVTAHFTRVQTWVESGKTSPSTLPLVLLYKRCLMGYYGYSEAEALNMALPKVIWEYTAWLEAQGAVRLVDDEEREILAEIKTEAGSPIPKEVPTS